MKLSSYLESGAAWRCRWQLQARVVMKTQMRLWLGLLILGGMSLAPPRAAGYYDPGVQRWINRDPVQENGGRNLSEFVGNNPISSIDPLGLEAGYDYAVGGSMSNYISRHGRLVYYPIVEINNLLDGFLHYLVAGGAPAVIGRKLANDLQFWQKRNKWPITKTACNRVEFSDYGSWDRPLSSFSAALTLGEFRYTDDGTTTTASDYYSFPLGGNWGNAPLYFLFLGNNLGTPYPVSGSWPTPR